MSRVITFSRVFPSYHPRKGEPTYFVEKLVQSFNQIRRPGDVPDGIFSEEIYHVVYAKNHTIRSGHRWKVGDKFSPRVWSGKPYQSKQIIIAPDIEVKNAWDFDLINDKLIIGGLFHCLVSQEEKIDSFAKNDGLNATDLLDWFKYPKPCCDNQIICWNDQIEY